jgi:hypothetical protein
MHKEYELNAVLLKHTVRLEICELAYLCIIDDRVIDIEKDIVAYEKSLAAIEPTISKELHVHVGGIPHEWKRGQLNRL